MAFSLTNAINCTVYYGTSLKPYPNGGGGTQVKASSTLTSYYYLAVVPDDGYEFENSNKKYLYQYSGGTNYLYYDSDTGYLYSPDQKSGMRGVTATATEKTGTTSYTITQTLTNCTSSISDTSVEENTELTFNITPNSGYYFATVPTINGTEMTATETGYTATITVTKNVTVVATASQIVYRTITQNLSHCTSNITETQVTDGTSLDIVITPETGYYFTTVPTVEYMVKGVTQSDEMTKQGDNYVITFVVNYNITIKAIAQVNPDPDPTDPDEPTDSISKYGVITVYNPTTDELRAIGNKRYMGTTNNAIDLGDYIATLIKVFVNVPDYKTATVLLGGYNTGVESNVVINDVVETDCGTVEIVGNYNNAMDYQNTTIEIYLPLIGFETLDPVKVMGETISLIYRTNIINGDTIACIYNTTGTLLYTFSTNASFEIPYRLNAELETQGDLSVNASYLFGFTPFVTVRYNKPYNTVETIAPDDRLVTLSDVTGLVKCDTIFNTVSTTSDEKQLIENLLTQGVIL